MHYIYILLENDSNKIYIGYANNLEQRLKQHKSTKDIELIYYEAYRDERQARERERRLKMYGSAWRR